MATDLEKLVVQLEARTRGFEKQMERANRQFNKQMREMQKSATANVSRINKALSGIGAVGAATGIFSIAGLRGAQQLIDTATRIQNSLKVAGLQGEELKTVYDALFKSAQRNAAPMEALVTLYGRASLVQKELNVSSNDLLNFSDKVAVALRVSGQSAQESSGALLQLSQALGSGVVRAEEFNSILEGALPIAQAAAAGLKEAGGSVAKLRQLVVDGKVSSEAFFRAFEAGSVILERKVAGAELTVSQGFVRLQNVLIDTAGKINDVTGAGKRMGAALETMSGIVEGAGKAIRDFADSDLSHLADKIYTIINPIDRLIERLGGLKNLPMVVSTINQAMFDAAIGKPIHTPKPAPDIRAIAIEALGNPGRSGRVIKVSPENITDEQISDRINEAFAAGVKSVSIDDYKVPGATKSGGSGAKNSREKVSQYDNEVSYLTDRTAALIAETEAMRMINPLINDYGYAIEKARAEQELLNAAQKAGVEITPELRAQIAQTAEQFALATVEANQLAEAQDKIRQRAEEWQDAQKDAVRGIVDDLIAGKSAAEAFAGALDKIISKLLDMTFDDLFTGIFKGGGGIFGGLFRKNGGPIKAATGGYIRGAGGPRTDSIPAMLSNGEYVINAAATKQNRALLEAINSGRSLAMASGGLVGLRAPTMPVLSGANRQTTVQSAPQININITSASGDDYIRSVVSDGVNQGLRQYDKSGPMRFARDSKQVSLRGLVR